MHTKAQRGLKACVHKWMHERDNACAHVHVVFGRVSTISA